jgi:uncharacterized protein (DUF486 family)
MLCGRMTTILLLCLSNIFMIFTWYGHLKFLHDKPLWVTILISWGIAFLNANAFPAASSGVSQVKLGRRPGQLRPSGVVQAACRILGE